MDIYVKMNALIIFWRKNHERCFKRSPIRIRRDCLHAIIFYSPAPDATVGGRPECEYRTKLYGDCVSDQVH